MLDLTDGTQHNIYTIRSKQLVVWTGLTPTQVGSLGGALPNAGG